jgi:integrase
VLDKMAGEAQTMMMTIFGSGIELGALLAQTGASVNWRSSEQTMVAPGSKNEYREERTIFVRNWAWPALKEHARHVLPKAPLWTLNEKQLREAFYNAQVAAGVIEAPAVSKRSGKKQWGAVNPHTIHDARHSYVVNAMLGLDGEEPIDIKQAAHQLGHADEQQVMKVYGKANIRQRLELIRRKAAGGAR